MHGIRLNQLSGLCLVLVKYLIAILDEVVLDKLCRDVIYNVSTSRNKAHNQATPRKLHQETGLYFAPASHPAKKSIAQAFSKSRINVATTIFESVLTDL